MHTAVRLNELILDQSANSQLVLLNLPKPPAEKEGAVFWKLSFSDKTQNFCVDCSWKNFLFCKVCFNVWSNKNNLKQYKKRLKREALKDVMLRWCFLLLSPKITAFSPPLFFFLTDYLSVSVQDESLTSRVLWRICAISLSGNDLVSCFSKQLRYSLFSRLQLYTSYCAVEFRFDKLLHFSSSSFVNQFFRNSKFLDI